MGCSGIMKTHSHGKKVAPVPNALWCGAQCTRIAAVGLPVATGLRRGGRLCDHLRAR